MNKIFTLFLCFLNCYLYSQTYNNPVVEFSFWNNIQENKLTLTKVEQTTTSTILHLTYNCPENYVEPWISISSTAYIAEYSSDDVKYPLIKATNIATSPAKTYLKSGEKWSFSLTFKKLPNDCRVFDFIEDRNDIEAFHLFKISLIENSDKYYKNLAIVQEELPDIIISYFAEKINLDYLSYSNVYSILEENLKDDIDYIFLGTKTTTTEGELRTHYSFKYKGNTIAMQELGDGSNGLLFVEFKNNATREKILNGMSYIFKLEKEDSYYTFKGRLFDMISIMGDKTIGLLSLGFKRTRNYDNSNSETKVTTTPNTNPKPTTTIKQSPQNNDISDGYKETRLVSYNSPILEKPDMVSSKIIGRVESNSVVILEKYSEKYYKVKSGNIVGYLWIGWLKK